MIKYFSVIVEFFMFKIECWWNTREYEIKHTVVKVAIRYSNCQKITMIDMDNMNTIYQDIINFFLLNTMLHRVGMLWITRNHEELKYDIDIQNSDSITGGIWYNTYICKKLYGNVFKGFI